MHGLGRTWPNYVGWAQPSPCEQCPPLFTCYVNSGGKAGTKQEKKEGEKGWPTVAATVVCATGGDRRRRWRFAVLFFFSLSILCFTFSSLLLLLSAFPLSFLFFLFSSLLCPLSSVLAFFSLPPCFYRQKQCTKRRYFGQNAPFHLNKNGAKLMLKYKSVLNLWFVQSSPELQFWF